jgi:uncharacterized membrane protein (UPF0182 family)
VRPTPPFGRAEIRELRMPRPPRWFGRAAIAAAIVILALIAIGPTIVFWTDLLWFQALGLQSVLLTAAGLQGALFVVAFAITFAYLGGNALLALRSRVRNVLVGYGIVRRGSPPIATWLAVAGAALVALIVGLSLSSEWEAAALFFNGSPTGTRDPLFGLDVSFYLFALPFLELLVGWAIAIAFLTALVVAALHAWQDEGFSYRLSRTGIGHVSIVSAVLAGLAAVSVFLGRYNLLFSHNGYVWGAGYTDVYARLPLAITASVVAVLLTAALIANARLYRRWLPLAALGVWIVFGIGTALYAAGVQRFAVQPNEYNQERPFISRELQFTRQSFGLDHVQASAYAGDAKVTPAAIASDSTTIDNLRLWDYRPLKETYAQLQTIRTYYTFHDIDLDRYTVNDKKVQVEISARELDTDQLPPQSRTWVAQKLTYTHGYGVGASPVNSVVGDGLPALIAKDLPPAGDIKVDRPAIYFGETTDSYVLAPSAQREFDYPSGSGDRYTSYTGTHGVRLDGLNRLAWSLRAGDLNLLISNQITPKTQILYNRSIANRLNAIAPFLSYDRDPYIVVADGKLYWIVDAYTTADTYPYSQAERPGVPNLPTELNYIRNSVKVVVDPYEGTATYYVVDAKDPVLKAYRKAFPALFRPISDMSTTLRQHIRYPVDLFAIQASVYRSYHIQDPQVFYLREDVWAIPNEPSGPGNTQPLEPYYVLMRLPGTESAEYLVILPFTPNRKQNMISWLAARNDGANYGQLVLYQLPESTTIFGPQQIGNAIQENTSISSQFTLWNQSGSQVLQGNLLVVPVGGSFLYFEPVYLRASGEASFPQFKKVILADSQTVVWDDTLPGALAQLLGQQPPAPAPSQGPSPPAPSGKCDVTSLVTQANQHYQAAQDRLKAQDLSGYASEINQVGQLLQQAQSCSGAGTASPAPAASPRPSPSPTR